MTAVASAHPQQPNAQGLRPFILVRAAVVLGALGAAFFHLAGGEASIPLWLWKVAQRIEVPAIDAVRILAALEMTVALVVLLCGRLAARTVLAALLIIAFSTIAELSARWNAGAGAIGIAGPLAALVASGALLASRQRWWPQPLYTRPASPGLGSALAAIGLLTFSLGAAARLPVADQPRRDIALQDRHGVLFPNPSGWVGKTLPESGLARHLPQLTPATLEGRHLVVFYSPSCGRCHDFFRDYLGGGPNPSVIAVHVPLPPDLKVLESDQPADVECEACRRLTLPEGPNYFQHTPLVMSVIDGRISCVEWRNPEKCLPR